jgi:anthranilate phosphoribosyltransferase
MMRELLPRLIGGERLTRDESASAIRAIVRGECDPAQIGAFLALLAQRGETAEELAGGAEALRSEAVPFPSPPGTLLDTCGTGGDNRQTFNVSTAVALVAAASGVRVAKHGSRSVSGRCGSADVLEALGARVELGPRAASRVLEETGFCFLFAPRYHPSMRHVAGIRRALAVRTLFNWMGPLSNPARATHQLIGIPDRARLGLVARVVRSLGIRRALVVHGAGGLDELALERGNEALLVEGDREPVPVRIEASELGLSPASADSFRGGDAPESAGILRAVLAGETGPRRDLVLVNAAAALWLAERSASLEEALRVAARAIDRGDAIRTLERYVSMSQESIQEEEA